MRPVGCQRGKGPCIFHCRVGPHPETTRALAPSRNPRPLLQRDADHRKRTRRPARLARHRVAHRLRADCSVLHKTGAHDDRAHAIAPRDPLHVQAYPTANHASVQATRDSPPPRRDRRAHSAGADAVRAHTRVHNDEGRRKEIKETGIPEFMQMSCAARPKSASSDRGNRATAHLRDRHGPGRRHLVETARASSGPRGHRSGPDRRAPLRTGLMCPHRDA